MIFIYLKSKDNFVGTIYGDTVEVKNDKEFNIYIEKKLIASIDFEKIEKIRKRAYELHINV